MASRPAETQVKALRRLKSTLILSIGISFLVYVLIATGQIPKEDLHKMAEEAMGAFLVFQSLIAYYVFRLYEKTL